MPGLQQQGQWVLAVPAWWQGSGACVFVAVAQVALGSQAILPIVLAAPHKTQWSALA